MQTSRIRKRNRWTCFKQTVNPSSCQQERRKEICCFVSKCNNRMQKKNVGRLFFRRLRANHPQLKTKYRNTVCINRGLRCTHEMAIEHLDELDSMLIETGIAPDLKKIEPGVWSGKIDTAWIWAHDETPQFINYKKIGLSRKSVCRKWRRLWWADKRKSQMCGNTFLYKLQRKPSSLQVIFSGSGHNCHMCPKSAAEKVPNLIISVNDSGCSDHTTLHAQGYFQAN